MALRDEVREGHARGWQFTPLKGKRPKLKGWQNRGPADVKTSLTYARQGNVGLRTGTPSGVVVIDGDDGADIAALNLPKTVTVITGGGGTHHYFKNPGGVTIRNSQSRIAPHVDVRGEGGQVVYPGSIHPDTQRPYRWADGLSPDDVCLAAFPAHLIEILNAPVPAARARGDAGKQDQDRDLGFYSREAHERSLNLPKSMRESAAWRCLSPNGKVLLLEMLDTYNALSHWGKRAAYVLRDGFKFTWAHSREAMSRPTFRAARADVVAHRFFVESKGAKGEASVFRPSEQWRTYEPTPDEALRLKNAAESKAKELRQNRERRAEYQQLRAKQGKILARLLPAHRADKERSLPTVKSKRTPNMERSFPDLLQSVRFENCVCALNPPLTVINEGLSLLWARQRASL